MFNKLLILCCFLPLQSCLIEADQPASAVATHLETAHFSFAFPVGFFTEEQMIEAAKKHEKAFAELAQIFPVSPQFKIKVYWVYEIEDRRNVLGVYQDGSILYSFDYYNGMKIFERHELAHSFQYAYFSDFREMDYVNSLIVEGMAEAFTEDFNSCNWFYLSNHFASENGFGTTNGLYQSDDLDKLISNSAWSIDAYTIGAIFNRYLYLKLGNKRYFTFVKNTTHYSYEESAKRLGFSFEPLVLEFKKIIQSTPTKSPNTTNSNNCELPFTPLP